MEATYQELFRSKAGRPKILVVDDQSINIRLVGEIFKDDFDVFMALDGTQAINQCQARLPDLVLLDLVMPGMDGYEVCRLLKADVKTKHIPIIFLTSKQDGADEALGFELGAVDYVTKPFNQTVLRARVETHLTLKLQSDRLRTNARFMRTLTDNIPGLITYWNADLTCTFSNSRSQQFYGKTPKQMIGISVRDLIGEELFAVSESLIKAALRGVPQKFERTVVMADESRMFAWVQYVPDMQDGQVHGFIVLITDVSELKQAQMALEESEQFIKTTIDTVPETICVLDKMGTVIAVNQAWRDFYDANFDNPQSINYGLGTNYLQVCKSATGAEAEAAQQMAQGLEAILAGERELFSIEYPCDSPTEKRFFFAQVKRFAGNSGHALVAHGNITERKLMELELARMAQTDVLTGLNNRRHFIELTETELSRTARHGGALSVMMLDIDHFKHVNDTHGHQVGDTVIQTLARLCRHQLRDLDVIGRLGGEEFAVTMPNTDNTQAMHVAERLRQAIESSHIALPLGGSVRFTVSIGVTTLTVTPTQLPTLLDQADQALYRAKSGGRNRVCSFLDTP